MLETPSYQRLFAELKRRRVFRVAAMYGATSFVVLQVADLLQEGLQLPPGFLTVATVLALVGFPVALILAWLYERTPHGVVRTPDPRPDEIDAIVAEPMARRWPVGIAAALGTALLLVSAWWALGRPEAPGGSERGDYSSIAVLPFENMSGNEADAYFADGLSEELLNALTRVPGLRVAGRTSSFSLRDSNLDLKTIADTLGVETVLEGSVRRSGGRVRVTAQLIEADDGFHLWSQDWERELTADNVFEIQDEIAGAVALAMATGEEPTGAGQPAAGGASVLVPASVRTSDLGAYELYLAGRHHWSARTPQGLEEAKRLFEEALERDSLYVPAWVGLSAAYNALPWYSDYPAEEAAERSRSAAERALELDPGNAEALYTLAVTIFEFELAWEESARLFERAIALDPTYSQGLSWYCFFLAGLGSWEEAIRWCERSVELDPLRVHHLTQLGEILMVSGRYEEALRHISQALALQPEFPYGNMLMTLGLAALGRLDEAESSLRLYARDSGIPDGESAAATIIGGLRDPSLREDAAAEVLTWLERGEAQAYWVVDWLELMGEREEALDIVDRMFETSPHELSSLNSLLVTDALRGEPRFDAAIAALGIPAPPPASVPVPW
ncbi:MAG: tetratricopeptide repeat protein [marine benthic group bacterium]|nr:tetratricopeptide repeat protein [Gemmatimonadota bacterium]